MGAIAAQVAFSCDALAVAALQATRRGATPLGQPARDALILHPTRRLSLCAGPRLLCSVAVALPPLLALSPYARFSRDRDPRRHGVLLPLHAACMLPSARLGSAASLHTSSTHTASSLGPCSTCRRASPRQQSRLGHAPLFVLRMHAGTCGASCFTVR